MIVKQEELSKYKGMNSVNEGADIVITDWSDTQPFLFCYHFCGS